MNGLLKELRSKFMEIGKKYEKINQESELMKQSEHCPEEILGMIGEDLAEVSNLIGEYLGETKKD